MVVSEMEVFAMSYCVVGDEGEGRFRGGVAGLFGLSSLSRLFRSQHQTNQTNQIDQTDQTPAARREMLDCKTWPLFSRPLLLTNSETEEGLTALAVEDLHKVR